MLRPFSIHTRSLLQLVAMASLASATCGANCIGPIDNRVGDAVVRLDTAITNLGTSGDRWMAELQALAGDLQHQGLTSAAAYVRDTVQNSIARVGIEYRCNVDFTLQRIRGSLVALRDAIRAVGGHDATPQPQPAKPFVCSVTPDRVSWKEATASLSFAGFDLSRGELTAVVVAPDQRVRNITSALTQSSPYQLVLNLSSAGAGFPLPCQHIELRLPSGAALSQVSCVEDCPPAPAPIVVPADEKIVLDRTLTCTDSFLTGCRLDQSIGSKCPDGYQRKAPFDVGMVSSKGAGNCGEGNQDPGSGLTSHWQSGNADDCAINAHIGVSGGLNHQRTCRFIVRARRPEQTIPRPRPIVGWCR